jgi:hypothetical protein
MCRPTAFSLINAERVVAEKFENLLPGRHPPPESAAPPFSRQASEKPLETPTLDFAQRVGSIRP